MAMALSRMDRTEDASRLWAAVAAWIRGHGRIVDPLDAALSEREVMAARVKVSGAIWEAAWKAGLVMTPEETIHFAMSVEPPRDASDS